MFNQPQKPQPPKVETLPAIKQYYNKVRKANKFSGK